MSVIIISPYSWGRQAAGLVRANLRWQDLKGSNARQLKVTPKLMGLLNGLPKKWPNYIFRNPKIDLYRSSRRFRNEYMFQRRRASTKLNQALPCKLPARGMFRKYLAQEIWRDAIVHFLKSEALEQRVQVTFLSPERCFRSMQISDVVTEVTCVR